MKIFTKSNFTGILFAILSLFAGFFHAPAQLLTSDNVNVTIGAGSQLTVQGDIQNQNGTTITNNGTIDLSGNWIHNSANNCFGTSAGLVIMNGANQNIGGTNSTIFNNLTFIGSGTKTLQQDITVGGTYIAPAGALSLGDRNLDLNSRTLIISNPSQTGITRNTAFIISETQPVAGYGYIRWNIGSTPPGSNYVFPFGNAATNNYLPLNFNVTSGGIGAGFVKIATYPTNTAPNPNNRPLPTGLTALINNMGTDNSSKVVDRYYIFDVQGFTTLPVSTMVFSYRDSEWNTGTNVITEANLKMQRLNNGTQWTQPPFGTVNTAANTVTVTGQNNYSPIWTIVDLTSPLPVTFLNLTAMLNEKKQTDIYWQTATETNSANFEIQKSKDAAVFETFAATESHHNSTSIQNYHSLDPDPYKGITYYRIKQNDLNGNYAYSGIVSVRLNSKSDLTINVYPNPVADWSIIHITSSSEIEINNCSMRVINVLGEEVMDYRLSALKVSDNNYRFSRSNLAAGIYYLSISDEKSQLDIFKLILQ